MQREWMRVGLYSAVIALCFAVIPDLAMRYVGGESPFWFVFGVWMLPGAFVGMVAAGGHIHDVDPLVIESIDFAFYFGIAYLFLTFRQRRKRKGTADC